MFSEYFTAEERARLEKLLPDIDRSASGVPECFDKPQFKSAVLNYQQVSSIDSSVLSDVAPGVRQ